MSDGASFAAASCAEGGISIALSGGGVRAMAFHAGVLRFLAEQDQLGRINHLSTVSGGSLLIGLLFQEAGMQWPSSAQYLSTILPAVRARLTTCDLQRTAARKLLLPWNWRFVVSRANLFVHAIQLCWGIDARLADLPAAPMWSINGTTAETGRRFRFKGTGCGDYQLGYADASAFPLAHAMAVSAAFPGLIGPLALKASAYTWRKRPHWDADASEAQVITLPFKRLHLYDGGLYDNLGLEPLFDGGRQIAKQPGTSIFVSDAGAPLEAGFTLGAINPMRMKRWLDLATEQQRALRVRGFVNALQEGLPGAYFQIGTCATDQLKKYANATSAEQDWLAKGRVLEAAQCPTSLARLSESAFDLLCRHGYETAHWNNLAYRYLENRATSTLETT